MPLAAFIAMFTTREVSTGGLKGRQQARERREARKKGSSSIARENEPVVVINLAVELLVDALSLDLGLELNRVRKIQ